MNSKIAWIIAIAMFLAFGAFILSSVVFPGPTPPTRLALQKDFLELHDQPAWPEKILGPAPSAPGNAGDDYARAVALWKPYAAEITSSEFYRDPSKAAPGKIMDVLKEMHKHVVSAATKSDMRYIFVHTPQTFEVGINYEPINVLQDMALGLDRLGTHYFFQKRYADSERVFLALLAMGRHMVAERSRVCLVQDGLMQQGLMMDRLIELYGKWDDAHRARLDDLYAYRTQVSEARNFYQNKFSTLWKFPPSPGDALRVAAGDKDRAWRIQGILQMGVLRFGAPQRGDQRALAKILDKYRNSSDPMEAAAAKAAAELTIEQYRQLGTK